MEVQRSFGAARSPSETQVHNLYVSCRLNPYDLLPPVHSVIQVRVSRPRVVLGYALLARSHLLSSEQQAIAVKANRGCGRPGGINIYQLQSIVLAEEVEALAIDEFWTTEYILAKSVFMGCELLVNPDQFCLYQFVGLVDIGIFREVSHK